MAVDYNMLRNLLIDRGFMILRQITLWLYNFVMIKFLNYRRREMNEYSKTKNCCI